MAKDHGASCFVSGHFATSLAGPLGAEHVH